MDTTSAATYRFTSFIFFVETLIFTGLLLAWQNMQPGYVTILPDTVLPQEVVPEETTFSDIHTTGLILSAAPKDPPIVEAKEIYQAPSLSQKYTFDIEVSDIQKAEAMQATFLRILESRAYEPFLNPITVEITDQRTEPRGRMTEGRVSLVVTIPSESEIMKVFVHELAHVIDLEHLVSGTFSADPSEKFYNISWLNLKTKKKGQKLEDFPSGYAMTNKYEDFAESFSLYVFHNEVFARNTSPVMQQKYAFFQEYLFKNNEWQGTDFALDTMPSYLWDTTKIPVATKKYLFYIK